MITEDEVIACKQGRNNDLTIVQEFTKPISNFDDYVYETRQKHFEWCRKNIGLSGDKWCSDGVTVFSFRILFTDREDAIAFELRFGLWI